MHLRSRLAVASLVLGMLAAPTLVSAVATTVNLGTATSYAVLAASTITNTGPSVINGDLGLDPGSAVTGFGPGTVNGATHVSDAAASQAKDHLVTAYDSAAGQATDILVAGDLGGLTLVPGVYTSATTLGLTGTLTLDALGDPDAAWVFQVGSALTTASASDVLLVNGAQACNVTWQVGSSATLGTNSDFVGSILAMASITLTTGADIDGRALAREGAVTLDDNVITVAACAAAEPTPTPTPTASPTASPTPTPAVTAAPTATPTTGASASPNPFDASTSGPDASASDGTTSLAAPPATPAVTPPSTDTGGSGPAGQASALGALLAVGLLAFGMLMLTRRTPVR